MSEDEHTPSTPMSYLLLSVDEADALRRERLAELEREHYRLGLRMDEGDRSERTLADRDECLRRVRLHAVELGLIEPPRGDEEPAPKPEPGELPEPPAAGDVERWRAPGIEAVEREPEPVGAH